MISLISAEQNEPAKQYLAGLPTNARLRGEKYWRQNRVSKLLRGEDENHIYATVRGTEPYQVSLYFSGGNWEGTCTCMASEDCKHCCAAMLDALDRAKMSSRVSSFPASPAATKAPAPPPEDRPGSTPKVAAIFRAKLERTLSSEEQRAAGAVDEIFKHHRDAKLIAENVFDRIRGTHATWSWNSVALWPKSPATPWETWLYVAALIRRKDWNCPPALLKATDWDEVDAVVGSWERNMRIEKWENWLRSNSQLAGAPITPEEIPLRARLTQKGVQLEWRRVPTADFSEMKPTPFKQHLQEGSTGGKLPFESGSLHLWRVFCVNAGSPLVPYETAEARRILNTLLRLPGFEEQVVNPAGVPFIRCPDALVWSAKPPPGAIGDYHLALTLPDGSAPTPAMVILDGAPSIHITHNTIYRGPSLAGLDVTRGPLAIPSEALETRHGLALFQRLALPTPERIVARTRTIRLRPVFRCTVEDAGHPGERFQVIVRAETEAGSLYAIYGEPGWIPDQKFKEPAEFAGLLVDYDRSALRLVPALVDELRVSWHGFGRDAWTKQPGKHFPEQFAQWLAAVPPDSGIVLEVDPLLATLRDNPVSARVTLDVQESGIDWFDLRVALDVSDTTLSQEEIRLLLDARGGFVRLGAKGWRRLQFQMTEEEESQLADVGLTARDFSSEPQRLHALQLAGKKAATRMMPEAQSHAIERRAEEIRTRVTPDVPSDLRATLRPYQVEGFHFLAYLAENHFGGILADDMGLGKTVQTLAWLLWLRAQPDFPGLPSLVVCPKSVTENWVTEAERFAPGLTVAMLPRGGCDAATLEAARKESALLVVNYTQLRLIDALVKVPWQAVILDEAQYIKNPQSQTAQSASLMRASYRIAQSGTPIENRLLDLWSIMNFTMPGILGQRASFSRDFDQRTDPLARRRLAARVRPFVIRRTKKEVASDLPERTEEDLLCELEGEQAKLYQAELKRARATLLKIKTSTELDKARFNILTSLLRLRQICCHPVLVNPKATEAESAKLNALVDLLEPLMEEGQKVLVFSQFVEMLNLIKTEITERGWNHFLLTVGTEDRGALVNEFQQSEGSAVFLISLRAGGFGLNLTAASYVVIYDPWWNPAVENQAIDRTHRIGQTNQVIAYRLIIKESIEEKIRCLQKQKSALAEDLLGEESFTRALSLADFRFLLEG